MLRWLQESRGRNHNEYALALSSITYNYEKINQLELAEAKFLESAELELEQKDGKPGLGHLYLAGFYARQSRFDKSEPLFRRYLEYNKENPLEEYFDSYHYWTALEDMARLYLENQLYDLATSIYRNVYNYQYKKYESLVALDTKSARKDLAELLNAEGLGYYYLKDYDPIPINNHMLQ